MAFIGWGKEELFLMSLDTGKRYIVIGAGPAGLTAAKSLLAQGCTDVLVIEQEDVAGGISKTVCHNGNRIDLGGHRFFSKSDEVMQWWQSVLPMESAAMGQDEEAFLVRHRLSRILYERKFFAYPVSLSMDTLVKLGLVRLVKIAISYALARLHPVRPEKSLEDFFVNRFGRELYQTFFRDYTQKVWGLPCSELSADWGAQRVKGLSVTAVLAHAIKSIGKSLRGRSKSGIAQKDVETSLIEYFLYPKHGPGSLWETVARDVERMGGTILYNTKVTGLEYADNRITSVAVAPTAGDKGAEETVYPADVVISSMPLQELVADVRGSVPEDVLHVARGLAYRDFMTVGLVLRTSERLADLKDNWIYVQEPDVHMGRIQIFNNWSPYLAKDRQTLLLGLEYFCSEGDRFWTMDDRDFIAMAAGELEKIGLARKDDVLEAFVVRVPKAYPAYFGSYENIGVLQKWLNSVHNLYPVGRNGMHRYNNMDHSMLSALRTVDCLAGKGVAKADVWQVNAEKEYHEEKG